jgi:hypothetical protein
MHPRVLALELCHWGFGSRRDARVLRPLAATALIAVAIIAPKEAAAKQIEKCPNPSLLRADERRLIATARRVLPPDLEPHVSGPCRWTDSAFAWITTEKFTEDTGVTHWWVFSCDRDERDWTCRPAVFQQEIVTQLVVGGISRPVKISFDGETSLEVAKTLASQALTIYANPAPQLPYCSGIKGQESRWRIFQESHPLPTEGGQIHLTVGLDRDTETVWIGDLVLADDIQIGIDFPFADDQSASCWSARQL